MFEMPALIRYNEVQTSFHVFENSFESIFVWDSDCWSNFGLKSLIFCVGSRYTISLICPRDSSRRESSLGSAQAMKSVHLFPSIFQEAFCPNILFLHWHSAMAHHPVGRFCFLSSLEAWEAKNTESFFRTYFLSHFRI